MQLQKYYEHCADKQIYIEKTFKGSKEEYFNTLKFARTLYVSNISENIREERLWLLFSILGEVRRIIPGINKTTLAFCGFCFVEFESVEAADAAINFFKDFSLDGKILKIDKDVGFTEGRQYGRGVFGGSFRTDNNRKRFR